MKRAAILLALSVTVTGCAGFRENYSPTRHAFAACLGKGLDCDPASPPDAARDTSLPGRFPSPLRANPTTEGPIGVTF